MESLTCLSNSSPWQNSNSKLCSIVIGISWNMCPIHLAFHLLVLTGISSTWSTGSGKHYRGVYAQPSGFPAVLDASSIPSTLVAFNSPLWHLKSIKLLLVQSASCHTDWGVTLGKHHIIMSVAHWAWLSFFKGWLSFNICLHWPPFSPLEEFIYIVHSFCNCYLHE